MLAGVLLASVAAALTLTLLPAMPSPTARTRRGARSGGALARRGSRARSRAGRAQRPGAGLPAARSAAALGASGGSFESAEVRGLVAGGRPVYCAGRERREVALTFDDGPGPYTRMVLAKLRKHHLSATFFVVARNITLVKGATREERLLGAVGDHTFTHPLLTTLPLEAARREIAGAKRAIERSSGAPVFLFRPPYGARDAATDGLVGSLGLLEVLWTVDSRDSLGASYAQIEHNRDRGPAPGSDHPHAREPRPDRACTAWHLCGSGPQAPAGGERAAAAQRRPARPGDAALSRCRLRRARGRPDGQLTRDLVGLAHAYS